MTIPSVKILTEALGLDPTKERELLYLAGAAAQLITILRASLEAGRVETVRLEAELTKLREPPKPLDLGDGAALCSGCGGPDYGTACVLDRTRLCWRCAP